MSKKSKKTVVFQNSNIQPAPETTIDQYVKALESSLSLPLNDNLNFHQILILAEEKKYKQQLIDSGILYMDSLCFYNKIIALPILLKHFYMKKANYEEIILNLINVLLDPDMEHYDFIALNASFLDMGFTFLISTIRLAKSNKQNDPSTYVGFC